MCVTGEEVSTMAPTDPVAPSPLPSLDVGKSGENIVDFLIRHDEERRQKRFVDDGPDAELSRGRHSRRRRAKADDEMDALTVVAERKFQPTTDMRAIDAEAEKAVDQLIVCWSAVGERSDLNGQTLDLLAEVDDAVRRVNQLRARYAECEAEAREKLRKEQVRAQAEIAGLTNGKPGERLVAPFKRLAEPKGKVIRKREANSQRWARWELGRKGSLLARLRASKNPAEAATLAFAEDEITFDEAKSVIEASKKPPKPFRDNWLNRTIPENKPVEDGGKKKKGKGKKGGKDAQAQQKKGAKGQKGAGPKGKGAQTGSRKSHPPTGGGRGGRK